MELHVLVVEGSGSDEWEGIKSYLARRKGVVLHSASTASRAYSLIRTRPVNIVISDYDLLKTNFLRFLRKVKSFKPHIEIIFLSKRVPLLKAIEAMKGGAYDFYEFPVNLKLLAAVMEKAIEKQALYFEKEELERQVKERFDFSNIVGRSKAMQHVMNVVRSVAPKNVTVLLTGETGTGKEMIANAITYNSQRASRPFIKVNCAAFNEGVLESELFGHERGAFTGALATRVGRFELADGGTIFLDEIGDVTPNTQIKLLRILQEKEFERVGSNETLKVDVRVIAATNQSLRRLVEEGRFREDLYYRLNVVHIELPPLRDRKEDIPLLVSLFINKLNYEKGYMIKGISKDAMHIIMNYAWPGNVRELENAIEAGMALSESGIVEAKYLPAFLLLSPPENGDYYHIPKDMTLREIERETIRLTLQQTGGNKTRAARLLGIGLRTLQRKAKEL
jgi:DNA-binding NtrC family response regulator